MQTFINIEGAKEHNLKNINVSLSHYSLTVFTGISGSGKSSLAFDTLYKEGQRRFIESLSPYARQFLGQMEKPKVDHIDGLSPAICIDQKRRGFSSRSTVGTITEIYDHLRLLFARLGIVYCPSCNIEVVTQNPDQISRFILEYYKDKHILILAPMVMERKGEYRKELSQWKADGFLRVRVDGKIHRLDEQIKLQRYEKHSLEIVVDRFKVDSKQRGRLRDDIEQAIMISGGMVGVHCNDEYKVFSVHRACPSCGFSIPELEPHLFSFNNTQGACVECSGRGYHEVFQESLIVPNPNISIEEGALTCIKKDGNIIFSKYGIEEITKFASHEKVNINKPWKKLKKSFKEKILYGGQSGKLYFAGLIPIMKEIFEKWNLHQFRRFVETTICESCQGKRLKNESLYVRFKGYNIADLASMNLEKLQKFFQDILLSEKEKIIGKEIFKEIRTRLSFLVDVGLSYLTLERRAKTLAGGEMQRIRLARQLGAALQGVLYILDEPSIGLHPRDNTKLLKALCELRDTGNTVVVIEHDEETMKAADKIIDIGPGAGKDGGEIIAKGKLAEIKNVKKSLTAQYLTGKKKITVPQLRRIPNGKWIKIIGAREHNLKNIDVEIPLGLFTVVTGISGSGKSTLVHKILHKALQKYYSKSEKTETPGKHKRIEGAQYIDKVIEVDQSPIGRTPRSNPATYIKVFDEIRNLFTQLPTSKARGYKAGRFSFNVEGGRCENCKGAGYKVVEMQFLSNVFILCEECNGKRFNRETLEIEYKGKNIFEILEMSILEANDFFEHHKNIKSTLEAMLDVGMGYIKLGQPSPTLSGGEAQRIKLVRELRKKDTGKTLYILDEPTTGLHMADIKKLLYAIDKLVQRGNSVLLIEHNLDVIKVADWIIDLGPEGGDMGGEVVVTGSPEVIMKYKKSYTGKALLEHMKKKKTSYKKAKNKSSPGSDIHIKGAIKHNLKNIDVTIPKGKMTVVTGVSGSGKSSLVFDTLFAEGQRSFLESLSTYARRFLGKLDHGSVDTIEGLAPAIAIDQKSISKNPRSTVATMTEIYDYLRILYSKAGTPHCPSCRKRIQSYTPSSVAKYIIEKYKEQSGLILAPLYIPNVKKSYTLQNSKDLKKYINDYKKMGFVRFLIDGKIYRIEEVPSFVKRVPIHLVIDRVKAEKNNISRIAESFETAFHLGNKVSFFYPDNGLPEPFSRITGCVACDYYQVEDLHPRMFSFNHYLGACPACDGLGYVDVVTHICDLCDGEKLKKEFLAVTIGNLSISEFCKQKIETSISFLNTLKLEKNEAFIAKDVIKEIQHRLHFLKDVGLEYLTLDRSGNTLSGGEAQRIRLATQIGNKLVGVLYVLDEPTIGLHQKDTAKLLQTLKNLVNLGNTVVMVEHDMQCIQEANHLLELGPGAGVKGGEIIAQGKTEEIKQKKSSLLGKYLTGEKKVPISINRKSTKENLTIHKAKLHNLKNINVSFKLNRFNVVTGVSGSGKSTLVIDILEHNLQLLKKDKKVSFQGCSKITGHEKFHRVVMIDQSPISKSPSSNPATYCKIFDHIRHFYASLPGSKRRGFKAGRFSFNKKEGRCEVCQGRGQIKLEMHFLSDVWVTCEACQGRRYLEETLAVYYKEKNIAQVLEMDIAQAFEFFKPLPKIAKKLEILNDIGLGYMKLGQATTTLSGGEGQRLKLVSELVSSNKLKTLYIMDEPTTGLHFADVEKLLKIVERLIFAGHTVIMIEHNLDVIRSADWIVDLGPDGGDRGGKVVCKGKLSTILKSKNSHTAESLRLMKLL